MIYYIKHLKDIIGNNYLGIDLPHTIIDKFLNDLKDILEDVDYNKFTENQIKRDGGSYHITVINVADYNRISKIMGIDKFINSLDPILKYPIDDLKLISDKIKLEKLRKNKKNKKSNKPNAIYLVILLLIILIFLMLYLILKNNKKVRF